MFNGNHPEKEFKIKNLLQKYNKNSMGLLHFLFTKVKNWILPETNTQKYETTDVWTAIYSVLFSVGYGAIIFWFFSNNNGPNYVKKCLKRKEKLNI